MRLDPIGDLQQQISGFFGQHFDSLS